jgi:outer membrane autotransporter protein
VLRDISGLSRNSTSLATRLDEICPRLQQQDDLSQGARQLSRACDALKFDASEAQAAAGLRQASILELGANRKYAVEISANQLRTGWARLNDLRRGAAGFSASGLNVRVNGQQLPGQLLTAASERLTGGGASADGSDFPRWGAFVSGNFSFGEGDRTENEEAFDYDALSFTIGADYRFTDRFVAGLMFSTADSEVDFDSNRSELDIDNTAVALYGSYWFDRLYIDFIYSYSWEDYDSDRSVSYTTENTSFDQNYRSDTDGNQYFLGLNSGYSFFRGGWEFGPEFKLFYLRGEIDDYREQAGGDNADQAWAFAVEEVDIEAMSLSAGFRVDYNIMLAWGVVRPTLRLDYVREFEDDGSLIDVRLLNNPFAEEQLATPNVTVQTDDPEDQFFTFGLGLSAQFRYGISGFIDYELLEGYDDFEREAVSAGLRWEVAF